MILFADGMGWYDNSASGFGSLWATTFSSGNASVYWQSTGGRNNGSCIRFYQSNVATGTYWAQRDFGGASASTIIAGFRYKENYNTADYAGVFELLEGGTCHVSLVLNTGGSLSLKMGGYTGTTLCTSANTLTAGTEYYIEIKAVIADSTSGSVELKVDGTQWAVNAACDTKNGGNGVVTGFHLGSVSAANIDTGTYGHYSDIYVCDGTAPNNDFLGEVRIDTMFPDGEGNYTALTASPAVSRNLNVDDAAHDGETSYNYATLGSATKDSYTMANPATPSSIKGVVQHAFLAKNGAGTGSARLLCRSGGSDYFSAAQYMSGATPNWTHHFKCYDKDPKTDAAWLIANLNAVEFGVEMT